MMCFAAKHLKFAIKANCRARGNYCCLNVFDQRVPLNFQAYFSLRNSTLASSIILNV